MFSKILVAVDGSPTSDKALQEAAGLASAPQGLPSVTGAELKVITVVDNPTHLLGMSDEVDSLTLDKLRQAVLEQAEAVLKGAQHQLEGRGVKAGYQLMDLTASLNRSVADGVLSAAQQWQADLIVIGTHGRHGLRRWLLGSVADQVIRASSCPVLIVRHSGVSAFSRQSSEEAFAEWPDERLIGN